ncbi:subclass B1 metallo-beta-lactamase [Photobacterium profundum]|uniref:subclass B1 metallo-beta-lactamase n=1 Tax=Photobacterium profundum TaxID=74109 RepID=UPI003D0AEC7D
MNKLILSLLFVFNLTSLPSFAENNDSKLDITLVTDNVYLVKSYRILKPLDPLEQSITMDANSIIYVDGKDAYYIDTPWNATDMPELMTWLDDHKLILKKTVFTHFHEDQTGGLNYLLDHKFETYASQKTNQLLIKEGKSAANNEFTVGSFEFLKDKIEVYYPGAGHTSDNLVVWLPKENVLIGGCLLRANEINNIGWIGDADTEQWTQSVQKVQGKFPNVKFVIPGHGAVGDNHSIITHTIKVVNEFNTKK